VHIIVHITTTPISQKKWLANHDAPTLAAQLFMSFGLQLQPTCIHHHHRLQFSAGHNVPLTLTVKPCSVRHECENQLSPLLPTRLLDLGDSNSSIKLWETSLGAQGEYACLSHCWGTHQPLRTQIDNMETSKRDCIPWTSIPKTFQDAIAFTRSLKIRFLWIDLFASSKTTKPIGIKKLRIWRLFTGNLLSL